MPDDEKQDTSQSPPKRVVEKPANDPIPINVKPLGTAKGTTLRCFEAPPPKKNNIDK